MRACCSPVSLPTKIGSKRRGVQRRLAFQLFQRLGPILFEQSRECAVGQQPSLCLTAYTIVRLVVAISNALHGRAAYWTRLAIAAVHGHPLAKGGNLLW